MTHQGELAHLLREVHTKGNPLVLFNIWDAGSAKALQELGAKAIATSSFSVARAHGYEDGERLPFDLVVANLERIAASVDIPITIDLEGGYSRVPMQIQKNVTKIINAGAVGINFEDQIIGEDELYTCNEQCERIKAVATAAEEVSIPIFINARTDVFLKSEYGSHNHQHLEEALQRASAYASSGADGFFAPGLQMKI